ncbi:MAG: thioredoxin domain-containing protein [Candidatus Micrarchaeota archaeon]
MVLCIIAFFVFGVMSIFSAKYRPLAKEGFRCVFRTLTMKPCDTGLDERMKAEAVSLVLKVSPAGAKVVNRHFTAISWVFVLATLLSFAYSAYGMYNFYFYGNCDGPASVQACVLNDLTGDYGRFSEPKDLIAPTDLGGITSGNPDAPVTIIEFGCFTCPYTGQAEITVHKILQDYNDTVYYVFKPFPLPNHANSYEIAEAVLCASRQGKEAVLREEVFEQQQACSVDGSPAIEHLARGAGLDMEAFNACMSSGEVASELDRYIQQGKDAHIYATPTFFINGKPLVGPQTISQLSAAIEEAR